MFFSSSLSLFVLMSSFSNITVATFSEFGFYKKEAYDANLWAGKILAEHGVPVAYKSVSPIICIYISSNLIKSRTT